MLWSAEFEWAEMQNPWTTFPIKKRINTDLFIDRMAALYKVDGRIRGENVTRVVNH